jgi:hypothetical protein
VKTDSVRKLLIPLFLIHCLTGWCQAVHYAPGSSYTALGAYSHQFTQAFSFLNNQASLAHSAQSSIGVFTERRFGLKELAMHMAAATVPVRGGGVGLALQYAGFNAFNNSRASLAYGKNLGRIGLGIQFNYSRINMAGIGTDAAIGMEISSLWQMSKKMVAGVRVANPVGGKYRNKANEKLASLYALGFGYEASDQVLLQAEIIKEEDRPLNVLAGVVYNIVPNRFFTRLGIATATNEPFFGAGWQWKQCRADVHIRYHTQLGFTPGMMMVFYGKQHSER